MTYLLDSSNSLQSTSITLAGMMFTLAMCLLLLVLPRRLAILPIAVTACYMTFGQQLVVAGLHFTVLRILVCVAYVRILVRQEYTEHKWRRLDTAVLVWSASSIVFFTILWETPAAITNRLGVACDTAGVYFAMRMLIRNLDDIRVACTMFALFLAPLAVCMGVEKVTGGHNPFFVFGGVPEWSEIRRGTLRCQGPFGHPILAGTFGAVWVPLFVGLWRQGKVNVLVPLIGLASSGAITFFAGSSGPIMTFVFGLIATGMWVMRRNMQAVRWAAVAMLVVLHMVMQDPVWFIFARVNILSGSTGWHRSNLIDQWVKHFADWWFCGTKDVGKWGVWAGDITNQYILEAVNGGIFTSALFITIFVIAFSSVGKAVNAKPQLPGSTRKMMWAVGAAVFAHGMTFLSVSYFDQNVVGFYSVLAMVAALATAAPARKKPVSRRIQDGWQLDEKPEFATANRI